MLYNRLSFFLHFDFILVFSQQEMLIPLVDRAVIQWHQYRAVSFGQVLLKVLCFQDAWKFNSMPSEPVLWGQTFKASSQSVEWTSHFLKLKEPFLSLKSFDSFVWLLPVIIQQLRLLAFLSFLLFKNWLSKCERIGKRLVYAMACAHTLLWMLLNISASCDNVKLFLKFLPNSILRVGTLRETKDTGITVQLDGMTLGLVTIQNNLICSCVPPFCEGMVVF